MTAHVQRTKTCSGTAVTCTPARLHCTCMLKKQRKAAPVQLSKQSTALLSPNLNPNPDPKPSPSPDPTSYRKPCRNRTLTLIPILTLTLTLTLT